MQIELNDLCFGKHLRTEDKTYEELSEEEKVNLLDKILFKIRRGVQDGYVNIFDVVSVLPNEDYKDLGQCEQCGHNCYSIKYEI